MKFTYRCTQVDRATNGFRNHNYTLDTATWLDHVSRDDDGLYGNSGELIQKHLLPAMEAGRTEELYDFLLEFDDKWRRRNLAIFEFAMYTWAEYKAGRFSADVWATVLSIAWQSGNRGMMAATKLSQSLVVDMFRAAPRKTLLTMSAFSDEDLNEQYASLPDHFQVYRGVSTGLDHFEDGLSWTFEPAQTKTFAALNCQNKREIPGYVLAVVCKESVLGMFSYEKEVVIDPSIPKSDVQKYFLRGKELREFHKQIDVEENTRDVILNTGYAKRHKESIASSELASLSRNHIASALEVALP